MPDEDVPPVAPAPPLGARLQEQLRTGTLPAPIVVAVGFAAGAVPFSGVGALLVAGVDLRRVGTGTVSGTGLYEVAGFGPLAVAGSLDVVKGAVGPWLAGRDRPVLAAVAAAASVTGHNWSPWLRGAGGRGVAPSLGALLAIAPEGAVVLGLALGLGRLVRRTGLAVALAAVGLPVVLGARRGRHGALAATAVVAPMLAKRVAGNRPLPAEQRLGHAVHRLLFDSDAPMAG